MIIVKENDEQADMAWRTAKRISRIRNDTCIAKLNSY